MRTTRLGHTAVEVSAVGLGAMHLSLAGRPPRGLPVAVIHRALELGVTFINTADAYCQDEGDKHHNEKLIHEALLAYEGDTSGVVVATKGGNMRPEGRWEPNGYPDHLHYVAKLSATALSKVSPIVPIDPRMPACSSLPCLEPYKKVVHRHLRETPPKPAQRKGLLDEHLPPHHLGHRRKGRVRPDL